MYIKSIVINGFKAYSGREVIDDLDPGLNVIVGRNGSGKTTLFEAIQFVLSEKFNRLNQNERQRLCNHMKQSGSFTLYVEIKFDNSDRALPVDSDEVCLKRDLTPKKDQFTINGKICDKEEVKRNFQLCGFYSREASFNIIRQGMVNSLAVANDAKRLNMVKQLTGSETYEEKMKATKEVLLEINNEIKQYKRLINGLDGQLKKLDSDKQKLTEYQELQARRKCVDYILLEQNLKNAENKLENLLVEHEETILHSEELLSKLKESKEQVQKAENNLAVFNDKLNGLEEKLQNLRTENCKLDEERAVVEVQIKNLTEQRSSSKDLKKLTKEITELTEKLAKINSKYNELKSNESKLCQKIALIEQQCQALRSKQNHLKQFASKEERDRYINNKLKQIEKDRQVENERLKVLLDRQAETKKELDKLKQLKQRAAKQEENRKRVFDCDQEKIKIQNELKELQRVERELKTEIAECNDKINKKHHTIMDKETIKGIESVLRVLPSFEDRENCYGLLVDIIDCTAKTLYKVIDTIAKKRLFHQVVATEEFALKLLDVINRLKLPGEVALLPLDKLNVQTVIYPETPDAKPLVKSLIYDDKFDPVIQHVFNRALICRNLNVAKNLTGTSKLNCITLEGDQVFGNGLVSGGYYNKPTRIEVYKEFAQMAARKSAFMNKLVKTQEDIRKCNERISQINQEKADLCTDVDQLKAPKEIELKEMEKSLGEYEKTILQVQFTLNTLRAAEESLKNELDQDMDEDTSVTDELKNLDMEKQKLSEREKKVCKDCADLQTEIGKIEKQLQSMTNRKEKIVQIRERFGENEALEKRLDDIEERLQEIEDLSNEIKKTKDETLPQKRDLEEKLEKWQEIQKKTQQDISRNKSFQHFAEKKSVFEKQIAATEKELDQLLMPRMELYEKYNSLSINQLEDAAKKLKKKLGKFSNIDLRLFEEELTKLSEQKDTCVRKIEAAKQSVKKLTKLMQSGQNKFYQFLESIIKNIDRQFRKIFAQLIPSGRAKLCVKRKVLDEENDDESDGTLEGIGIQVFFPGNDEGLKEIAQLSNGQKTLVALTLIFAIQKWQETMTGKPVPVYLFDEFDQNLDPQHRASVAKMIHDMSSEAQIIIITFRPELLEYAAKIYQVRYANGVSHTNPLNRREAANLVQSDDSRV